MKKKLAIRGDEALGKEIITLLVDLGGIDTKDWSGTNPDNIYFVNNITGAIDATSLRVFDDYDIEHLLNYTKFTYDEFWKYFPFKIGSYVCHSEYGYGLVKSMKWDGDKNTIKYNVLINNSNEIKECELSELTDASDVLLIKKETEEKIEINMQDVTKSVKISYNPVIHKIEILDSEIYIVKK
jgi:hypothetical protein